MNTLFLLPPTSCLLFLKLPELGKFEQHRVRVHERQREPRGPVEESAPEDVVPEKRCGRMEQDFERARAASRLVHLTRGKRRVLIDPFEVIAKVAIRIMLQLVLEPPEL